MGTSLLSTVIGSFGQSGSGQALSKRVAKRPDARGSVWWSLVAPAALLVAALGCSSSEPETHLLRPGFMGRVWIITDVPDGEPVEYLEGRRIYRVPAGGILRTQFAANDYSGDARFYFETGEPGTWQEITGRSHSTIHDTPEVRADDTIVIHAYGLGVVGAEVPGEDRGSSEAPCAVRYATYTVGRKREIIGYQAPDLLDYLEMHPVACAEAQ